MVSRSNINMRIGSHAPKFSGLLFNAELTPNGQRPKFTAYFGDYSSLGFRDGVVMIKPLDKSRDVLILEEDNNKVNDLTYALSRAGYFKPTKYEERRYWPWPDEARDLFEIAMGNMNRHSWLKNIADPFGQIFNGYKPQNANITFAELLGESLGYFIWRNSGRAGQIDKNQRQIQFDIKHRVFHGGKTKSIPSKLQGIPAESPPPQNGPEAIVPAEPAISEEAQPAQRTSNRFTEVQLRRLTRKAAARARKPMSQLDG